MWKRKLEADGGSGSTLKKKAGSGSKLGSYQLCTELEAETKNILLLPHPYYRICLHDRSDKMRFYYPH